MNEPLAPNVATNLIHQIVRAGAVSFGQHALDELAKDSMTTVDAVNVLRAGAVTEPAEYVRSTWRYRIQTQRILVVVAFRSETELTVVTAWRKRR